MNFRVQEKAEALRVSAWAALQSLWVSVCDDRHIDMLIMMMIVVAYWQWHRVMSTEKVMIQWTVDWILEGELKDLNGVDVNDHQPVAASHHSCAHTTFGDDDAPTHLIAYHSNYILIGLSTTSLMMMMSIGERRQCRPSSKNSVKPSSSEKWFHPGDYHHYQRSRL